MANRYETINTYLNKGLIEANIAYAINHNTSFCIAKFGFEVDIEDGFFFKDLIAFIHTEIGFNLILQHSGDTFLILLRDYKIHNAKTLLKKLEHAIKQQFKIEIKNVGITIHD